MKRHGFSGQPASHGASLVHRAMGSSGQSQGGGSRVYPGKKMAGRMGGQQVTTQNVKVLKVDNDKGIILLHGSFPSSFHRCLVFFWYVVIKLVVNDDCEIYIGSISGPNGCLVKIQDARRKPWPEIPSSSSEMNDTAATASV